ncbi:hypothetical protein BSU04_34780 [Caballeronia sordidicola]|jgi:hypothetical protein|uniref:Uncharacterized protein n=1 Tax=Caballeronia sordidicola TaxID=196367 RepID=A0A226WRN1_CABSO|nr:hypothetical protein BSU04_34780 [Caballeronia sordidicola]
MFIDPERIAATAQQHCADTTVSASSCVAAAYLSRPLHISIDEYIAWVAAAG